MNWIERRIAESKAKERREMLDDCVNVSIVEGELKVVVKGLTIDPSMFKDDIVEVVRKIKEENK